MSTINSYPSLASFHGNSSAYLKTTSKSNGSASNRTGAPFPTASNTSQLISYKASNLSEDAMKEKMVTLAKNDAKTKNMWSKDALQLYNDFLSAVAPDRLNLIKKAMRAGQVDGNTICVNGEYVARYDPAFGWVGIESSAEASRSYDFGVTYGDTYKAEVQRLAQEQSGVTDAQPQHKTLSVKV